ncbi:serine-rich adhesin for platelets-like isoform X2 [Mytilus edulis]|uniref:serine-rich adhesin for platelets-like isoform X2 n=1 Tax=Mytilus edulis TaxID=6550 RepID=UPI0039F0619C
MGSFRTIGKKIKMAMPRMQSSSSQCCLCSIGVFMFLFGIIMIATGASLILNYGIVNDDLLLPELRNDEGKKIVGIVLICVGLVFGIVSVSVSAYYFCAPEKHPTIKPDDIRSISNGSTLSGTRLTSTQRPGSRPGSNQSARSGSNQSARSGSNQSARSNGQGARRKVSPVDGPLKPIEKSSGSQFSQSIPSVHHRSKNKHKTKKKSKRLVTKTQLEDIKELDTVSRKTMDIGYDDNYDTPRSPSELDSASINTSETSSRVPTYHVTDYSIQQTDHSIIVQNGSSIKNSNHYDMQTNNSEIDAYHNALPGTASSENDSDDQIINKNKRKNHSHGSHDNPTFDGCELESTGSESTINKAILSDVYDEKSQTSSL